MKESSILVQEGFEKLTEMLVQTSRKSKEHRARNWFEN
jgi:hypothetical protein